MSARPSVTAALAVVLATVALLAGACSGSSGHASAQPGASTSGGIVWPRPTDTAAAIQAANLPALPAEGQFEHYHAHLDVIIDGQAVTVPANVGIDIENQRISPVHTHDTSGVIHIESTTHTTYTLGQFFTQWGVKLNGQCIGTFCAGPARQILATVNGQPVTGDPSTIPFTPHAQITLWSGPPGPPPQLPGSYDFPPGL
ncbi:MAG TPA: hypothetical protein VLL82_12860 [Mycobacterium sp.]|nr:hypothetical protein [Mycobacterium sp.]